MEKHFTQASSAALAWHVLYHAALFETDRSRVSTMRCMRCAPCVTVHCPKSEPPEDPVVLLGYGLLTESVA
jgi:hypothetical protein